MASAFEAAIKHPSFKLNDIKEVDIVAKLNSANDLCCYINKFLPHQFSEINEDNVQASEKETILDPENDFLPTSGKTSRAKTIQELYERIEKLKGKKIPYDKKLIKKGLKNRLKKKQKLEERKQIKNVNRKQQVADQQENVKSEETKDNAITEKADEVIKNNLQFNKFAMSTEISDIKNKHVDPKRRLQQIEKKNEKLKKIEQKGNIEKLRDIKTKESWDAAIQKAEGVKVKDNVELLKKSIAKIKQRKNKSKRKWGEREKLVETKKEEAQKKRQENINKKKKERSKKRTKVLVKKGRILPR